MCVALVNTSHYLGYIWLGAVLLACIPFLGWVLSSGDAKVNFRGKFLLISILLAFAVGVLAQLIDTAARHLC
jgi:hypothetical protein